MARKSDRSQTASKSDRSKAQRGAQESTAQENSPRGSSRVEQVDDQTGRSDREAGVGRPLQLDEPDADGQPRRP